ncbi:MAG: hypothetical protein EOP89_08190, partial [Lysobacteraceae bacterium]
MVQIPLISGIYGGSATDFERSVPVNLTPIAEPGDGSGTGVSKGFLKTVPGIVTEHTASGADRGAVVYDGQHLRVIGSTLYLVGVTLTAIGYVGDDARPVQFAEGFGRIAICSNESMYYYDGSTLVQVTDPDLGRSYSITWSDGYFLSTDGDSIVVTELNDPMSIDPLKYGSSEADPDPIVGLMAIRGEIYAINRYSIEKLINAGTTGFPFQRSRGAQIPKGCVGSAAYAAFVETFAFCGSARNESPSIYLAGAGQAIRISPRALDDAMASLSREELPTIELETLNASGLYQLYVHLPRETWVYHWTASQLLDMPVWSKLAGGVMTDQPWPGRHYQRVGVEWYCGNAGKIGRVDENATTIFDDKIGYRFDTPLIYNEGRGAIAHDAELTVRGTANVAMS